jgi:hypothetical protein
MKNEEVYDEGAARLWIQAYWFLLVWIFGRDGDFSYQNNKKLFGPLKNDWSLWEPADLQSLFTT